MCKMDMQAGKRQKLETPVISLPIENKVKHSLLHDFFNVYTNTFNCITNYTPIAVIFDDGKGKIEKISYKELDHGANVVKELLEKIFSTGKGDCSGEHTQEFVGVQCGVGVLYPILVLGILRSGNALYNIDPMNLERSVQDGVRHLGMKYILTSEDGVKLTDVDDLKKVGHFEISEGSTSLPLFLHVYQIIASFQVLKFPPEKFAYAIQTSGTTGEKKTVLVPHACICPNIEDFVENQWYLTKHDVIFGCAPPTFDPHIVELFSALAVGATILYTTAEVKLNGKLLANLLSFYQVSILQITPSLFRRLFNPRAKFSCTNFTPRIIAFGGETCPDKGELKSVVLNFPNLHNVTFQNVYGVTEVSCWATVVQINLESADPITIGSALKETHVTLDSVPNGEIIINSSTRYCVIIDSTTSPSYVSVTPTRGYYSGDLGVLALNNEIVFQGRKDRVVKRNGMKVSLHQIEKMVLSSGFVSYAECAMKEGKIYLMVKLNQDVNRDCHEENEMSLLATTFSDKLQLPLFMYPDYIIRLNHNSIPMNGNGKIDFDFIINSFRSFKHTPREMRTLNVTSTQIIETLIPIWKSCTHCDPRTEEDIIQEQFVAAGGTSISATRFIEATFMAMNLFGSETHQKWEQKLLCQLLNEGSGHNFWGIVETFVKIFKDRSGTRVNICNIDTDILLELQDILPQIVVSAPKPGSDFEFDLLRCNQTSEDENDVFVPVRDTSCDDVTFLPSLCQPPKMYKFPMSLCVDASPAIVPTKNRAIIGCHGGLLLCIDLNVLRRESKLSSLAIAWRQKFPNRIEATVEIHPSCLYAYVGCHDGNLYKFSIATGEVLCWISASGRNNDPVPIRSKCAISDDNLVITVDSGNSIFCADAPSLSKIWTLNKFKMLATVSPVIFRRQCLLTTLDRGIIAVENVSGNVLWITTNDSADLIYSSPLLVPFFSDNSKKRHRAVLFCAFNAGIEARDAKSGSLRWRLKSASGGGSQLLFSKCCNKLLWIESVTSNSPIFKFIDPETGKSIAQFESTDDGPITPSLITFKGNFSTNDNDSTWKENKSCYLCYKSTMENQNEALSILRPCLTLVSLHESASCEWQQPDDFNVTPRSGNNGKHLQFEIPATSDFESFSRLTVCSEFILLGGRDNNLHVIKF